MKKIIGLEIKNFLLVVIMFLFMVIAFQHSALTYERKNSEWNYKLMNAWKERFEKASSYVNR